MYFTGPINDYNQLAREAEIYYNSLHSEEEYEPFLDDEEEEIKPDEEYINCTNGLFSKKTIANIYKKCIEEGKNYEDFIKKIFGNDIPIPDYGEDIEYFAENYKEGYYMDILEQVSWKDIYYNN